MRPHLVIAGISLAVALACLPARAQDPEKIVDQYIKAVGGSKAISKIRTLAIEGTFTTPDGKTGTYTLDTRIPNRYYSELVVADQNVIEAYNGKSAWHQTQSGEVATLLGDEGAQLEAAGQYYNSHLVNAKKNKLGVGFAATLNVRGKDAYDLELTTPTGVKRHVFFDPNSHLIAKEVAVIGGVEQGVLYDDYRTVGGVKTLHDGPYAETREQLGGYYLIEAADLDAAIGWARKIPGGPNYSIEVRPIWPLG